MLYKREENVWSFKIILGFVFTNILINSLNCAEKYLHINIYVWFLELFPRGWDSVFCDLSFTMTHFSFQVLKNKRTSYCL